MGVDSLDVVVFMMAVEEEFQVEFTREDQRAMRTLADIARGLELATTAHKAETATDRAGGVSL